MMNNNNLKIAVVGPPHSGKSVFLGGLVENLPSDLYYLFRACPDGEGAWTWTSEDAAMYRRKGTFSKEIVNWYVSVLKKKKGLAPLTLIDLGGRITEENRTIITDGKIDAAIILAGDMSKVKEWESFLKSCNTDVIAVVHSDYKGIKDCTEQDKLSVHFLERGEDVSSRPAIKEIAGMLMDKVKRPIVQDAVLDISELAGTLGKKEKDITLPNGRTFSSISWEGADLPKISSLLHNDSANLPEVVKINGRAPAWLVTALAHECHPKAVALNSPDGYIGVGCQKPAKKASGENLEFKVEDMGDCVRVTCQQENPDLPLDPQDLDSVVPPEVPMGSIVVLSGRMPNWLVASLAMSYHGVKAVACFQPGVGATISITHSSQIRLGSLIKIS